MLNPKSEDALAAIIADRTAPLKIQGGGTRTFGRPVEGETLSTAALSGITLYEPGALTLVAQAGTPISDIKATLDKGNQQLAFEPMDHRALLGTSGTPTIGGAIAANVSGPRRVAVGAARDFLLGVRFVDGAGRIIKNGGRVMKNVTGYDLVKLMAGSYGTLGVLTEVSLKVMPKTETAATLVFEQCGPTQAVAIMSDALGSPFDVNGAAYRALENKTYIRIEGFEGSVAYRSDALSKHLSTHGKATTVTTDAHNAIWEGIRDVTDLAPTGHDVWRISVKPSDAPKVLDQTGVSDVVMDWGGGLIWAACASGTDLRAKLAGIPGHATLIRADDATRAALPAFHPEPRGVEVISNGLRQKFDPRGILNPGIML